MRTAYSDSALRVSAADKLHNARATLVDLGESEPNGTWSPHNACHHQSFWYYQAISDVNAGRPLNSRTGAELATVIVALYAKIGSGVRQPTKAQLLVPGLYRRPAVPDHGRGCLTARSEPHGPGRRISMMP